MKVVHLLLLMVRFKPVTSATFDVIELLMVTEGVMLLFVMVAVVLPMMVAAV